MRRVGKLILWFIFGIIILLVIKIAWMTRIERNRMAFSGATDSILLGGKFGVNVGMEIEAAYDVLLGSNFSDPILQDGGRCGGKLFPDSKLHVFSDIRWRRGGVYLGSGPINFRDSLLS